MSKVLAFERRLLALEKRNEPEAMLAQMSDEELEARCTEVRAAIEAHGVVFPVNFEVMPWRQQQAFLQSIAESA